MSVNIGKEQLWTESLSGYAADLVSEEGLMTLRAWADRVVNSWLDQEILFVRYGLMVSRLHQLDRYGVSSFADPTEPERQAIWLAVFVDCLPRRNSDQIRLHKKLNGALSALLAILAKTRPRLQSEYWANRSEISVGFN